MPKYGVYVTYKQTAYVEVDAENEEDAEEKGFVQVEAGNGEPYGSDEDYDVEVEKLEE
jgi:hypothetical protein